VEENFQISTKGDHVKDFFFDFDPLFQLLCKLSQVSLSKYMFFKLYAVFNKKKIKLYQFE